MERCKIMFLISHLEFWRPDSTSPYFQLSISCVCVVHCCVSWILTLVGELGSSRSANPSLYFSHTQSCYFATKGNVSVQSHWASSVEREEVGLR